MIPKIIHQIWEGRSEPLSELYTEFGKTWQEQYPDWKYEFWDGDRMDAFVNNNYPHFADRYFSFQYGVQRWDASRYLILDKIGGMYVDFDYESIAPLDELVQDKTCCFAMEPELHSRIAQKDPMFNNALMLSVPGHPFMQKMIDAVFSENRLQAVIDATAGYSDRKQKEHIVLHSTGPWMMMELYEQLPEEEKNGIYLIPAKYVSPFNTEQVALLLQNVETDELNDCLAEAYAVHYYLSLWRAVTKNND